MYQAKPSFKADASVMPFMPGYDYSNQMAQPNLPASAPIESQVPMVELPDIYYSPNSNKKNDSFVDKLRKVDVMELIVPWFEHPLLMLGTCFGISKGVDAFSNSCSKEYEKSILGKAAKFGDKIENSPFVQSKPIQGGLKGIRGAWSGIKKFAMKSDIIRSMVETPTMPEYAMPKSELLSLQERNVEKFAEALRDTGLLPVKDGQFGGGRKIDFHFDAEAVKDLKDYFKVDKISKIPDEQAVSRYLLKKANVAEAEIQTILNGSNPLNTARAKLVELAGGAEKLQGLLKGKTEAEVNEILQICEKFKGIKTSKGTKLPFTTKQPLTNAAGFQDVYNRMFSTIQGKGAATKTGKFMSKFLQMIHRGFTFGGAKTGVMIWVAPHIMHTLINTYKADKSEKAGTFVNGMISAISWVFVFPLVLKAIHAFGGIQYAGVSEANLKEKDRLIEEFKKNVLDRKEGYDTRKGWRLKRKECKAKIADLMKVKDQGFVTRVLRKISAFTKSDLKKLELFKDENWFKRTLLNSPAKAKDFLWSAGRFMVFMLVGMPLVDKVINKAISAVFGRNYDDTIEKENKEAKKKQKEFLHEDLQNRMYEAQAAKMGLNPQPQEQVQNEVIPEPISEEQNIEKKAQEMQVQNEVIPEPISEEQDIEKQAQEMQIQQEEAVPQTIKAQENVPNNNKVDNYTYIPSQENIIKTPAKKQISKYIPSQLPGNVAKTFDNSGLEAALRRADIAEARALQTLAGKFPS